MKGLYRWTKWSDDISYYEQEKIEYALSTAIYANDTAEIIKILKSTVIPENILSKYFKYLPTELVFSTQKLSWDFICANITEEIGIRFYLKNPNTNESELDKVLYMSIFAPQYFVEEISSRPNLSIEFINKHVDELDWCNLSHCLNIKTITALSKNMANKIQWKVVFDRIEAQAKITELIEILKTNTDFFAYIPLDMLNLIDTAYDWDTISRRNDLDINFLKTYRNKLNWNYCSRLIRSQKLLDEFKDVVVWPKLNIKRLMLSEDILEKYIDKFDTYDISRYQKLSEDFIRRHLNKVDLPTISTYQNISEDFREEFDLI